VIDREVKVLSVVVAALLAVGVVMAYSVSAPSARTLSTSAKFGRHLLYLAFALSAAWGVWVCGARRLLAATPYVVGVVAFLLLLCYVPPLGRRIRGAARWLAVGPLHLQPSEMAKIAAVLVAARFAALRGDADLRKLLLRGFAPIAVMVALILAEPDFGTAVFVSGAAAVLLFVAGARARHLALTFGVACLLTLPVAALKFGHVRERVALFMNPGSDGRGKGYQIRQSLIAIGSGGVAGRGMGASRQKLMFLPDRDTDFIFAIYAEETGFLGTMTILVLFAAYVVLGSRIALAADDPSMRVLAFGAAFMPAAQAFLNIAVVTAVLPTKGISLPFISFGGSSLLVCCAWFALLASVAYGGEGTCGFWSQPAERAVT